MKRPGRTFGTSVAILASVMLFSIFPLLDLMLLLLFRRKMGGLGDAPIGDELGQPIAMGSNFSGVSEGELLVHVALGLLYLALAVFAWRGRPPWIRLALVVMIIVLMGFNIATGLGPLIQEQNLAGGIDSGITVIRSLVISRLLTGGLISLYALWYLNRAPARAYFRGYYLTRPDDSTETERSSSEVAAESS